MKITRTESLSRSKPVAGNQKKSALEECGADLKVDCVIRRLERHQKGNVAHFELEDMEQTQLSLRELSRQKGKSMPEFEEVDRSRGDMGGIGIGLAAIGVPVGMLLAFGSGGSTPVIALGLGLAVGTAALAVHGVRNMRREVGEKWRKGFEHPRSDENPVGAPRVDQIEIRQRPASSNLKKVALDSRSLFNTVARTVEGANDTVSDLAPQDRGRVAVFDRAIPGGKLSAIASLDQRGRVRGLKAHVEREGEHWLTATRDHETGRLSIYEKIHTGKPFSMNLNYEVEEHVHTYIDGGVVGSHTKGWYRLNSPRYEGEKTQWDESGVVSQQR